MIDGKEGVEKDKDEEGRKKEKKEIIMGLAEEKRSGEGE